MGCGGGRGGGGGTEPQLQSSYKLNKEAIHADVPCRDGVGFEIRTPDQPTGDGVVPYPSLSYWRRWGAVPNAPPMHGFELDDVGHRPLLAEANFHAIMLTFLCAHPQTGRGSGIDAARAYASAHPALANAYTPPHKLAVPAAEGADGDGSVAGAATAAAASERHVSRGSMQADWRDPGEPIEGGINEDADGVDAAMAAQNEGMDAVRPLRTVLTVGRRYSRSSELPMLRSPLGLSTDDRDDKDTVLSEADEPATAGTDATADADADADVSADPGASHVDVDALDDLDVNDLGDAASL